jgi:hypothetical protein
MGGGSAPRRPVQGRVSKSVPPPPSHSLNVTHFSGLRWGVGTGQKSSNAPDKKYTVNTGWIFGILLL